MGFYDELIARTNAEHEGFHPYPSFGLPWAAAA